MAFYIAYHIATLAFIFLISDHQVSLAMFCGHTCYLFGDSSLLA